MESSSASPVIHAFRTSGASSSRRWWWKREEVYTRLRGSALRVSLRSDEREQPRELGGNNLLGRAFDQGLQELPLDIFLPERSGNNVVQEGREVDLVKASDGE